MNIKTERHGTFSSSQMWKLMKKDKSGNFGVPALKYIKQVRYELSLGRPVNKEISAKATSWGTFIEGRVFDMLPMEYRLVSKDRLFHPTIKHWSGAPDLIKENTVCDVKSPYSLETFCDKLEALKDIEVYKEEFPEDYWQHISNAILLEENGFPIKHFEAIIYVPYKSELPEIREMASNFDGNQNNISFLNWALDEELPFILDNGRYKNLNIFRFDVPSEDKKLLAKKVQEAGAMLIGNESAILLTRDEKVKATVAESIILQKIK